MKKLNLVVLFFLLLCVTTFGQIAVDPNRDPTAARDDLINVVPATGRTNLSVYSKAESDVIAADLESLLAQGSLKYYYGTATDSVTGGRLFTTSAISTVSSIVFPAITSTAYTWVNSPGRLTPSGSPGLATLLASTIEVSRYYSCDQSVSTGRSVTGINELWEVDANGSSNPEFIATSSEYVIFGTEIQRISYSYTIATDVTLGATRRLQERNYRKRTGVLTGANPVVTAYFGGSRSGLMSIQVPSEVVMLTNGSNKTADALANLGVWYVGNPTTAADTASTTLAVNGAAVSIPVVADQCGYIVAEVTGQYNGSKSFFHSRLTGSFENHDSTLALIGSPASYTDQINAATWSASLSVVDNVIKVVATGSVGAIWTCEKLEVK